MRLTDEDVFRINRACEMSSLNSIPVGYNQIVNHYGVKDEGVT